MRAPFELAGEKVTAGSQRFIEVPVAQLYTPTPVSIPVHVVHGRRSGPVLMVCAAIHGDELNGVEIIRRLLRHSALRNLRGTLLAVPVVNVFGFIHHSRYLPDRRDLNRCFPGSESGSLGARTARVFKEAVLDHATHGIDLHTGAIHRSNLPQVRANLDNPQVAELAQAFGVPVVMHSDLRDGSLRETADADNVPVITYEAGEALRYDESCVRAGLRGVVNVMRHLEMIRTRRTRKPRKAQVARSSSWVRADNDGVFRSLIALGRYVKEGDCIGRISDPFGTTEQDVLASCDGILVGRNNLPLVHEGEALFHIARYEGGEDLERALEHFQSKLDNSTGVEDEPPIAP